METINSNKALFISLKDYLKGVYKSPYYNLSNADNGPDFIPTCPTVRDSYVLAL